MVTIGTLRVARAIQQVEPTFTPAPQVAARLHEVCPECLAPYDHGLCGCDPYGDDVPVTETFRPCGPNCQALGTDHRVCPDY